MAKLIILLASFFISVLGPATNDEDRFRLISSAYLEAKLTVECDSSPRAGETPQGIIFRRGENYLPNIFFYRFTLTELAAQEGSQHHRRAYYTGVSRSAAQYGVMGLQCDDRGFYSCEIIYSSSSGTRTERFIQFLNLKGLPRPPTISITSAYGIPILTNQVLRNRSAGFSATCQANVGSTWSGHLVWKIFRQCIPDVPPLLNETRVVFPFVVNPRSWMYINDPCTIRVEHNLTIQFRRDENFLKVACFVRNDWVSRLLPISQQSGIPALCENPTAQMCNTTENIYMTRSDLGVSVIESKAAEELSVKVITVINFAVAVFVSITVGFMVGVVWNLNGKKQDDRKVTSRYSNISKYGFKSETDLA